LTTLFGPKKYIRNTGKPNVYKDRFPGTPGKGWLIIVNGEEDGQNRISSAIIRLNGKEVIGTKDFNQNVYRLRKGIDLLSNNNLVVELRSKPESYLRIEITTALANQAPIAYAGSDQTFYVHDTVTLDGSGSTDADGDPLTYKWTFISRPPGSAAVLSDPTAVNPTFSVDIPGTYEVQLIVNDGRIDSAPDTVTITTQNSPPVANAGPDQTVFVTNVVTLDGSGSSDVDGNSLTYQWSIISSPSGSTVALSDPAAVKPTFVVDKPGTYVAQLIVNDGMLDSVPDTVTISTQNSAPVAEAGPNLSVFVGDPVTLDGSKSYDVDGDLLSFLWSLTTRPSGSLAVLSNYMAVSPTFMVDKPGSYVAQLIVNDGMVDSAPDTVTITTLNSPPVADAGPNQSVFVGNLVSLDGSASTDVDGDPLTFLWAITSRPPQSTADLSNPIAVKPTLVVDRPGTYVAQLIVNDGTVNSAPDTVTVTTLNSAPVADAGPDQSVPVGQMVTLDGSSSTDADRDPLTYSWSFTARPDGSTAALANPETVTPSFTVDKAGTYVVQIIVNDGTVNSAPDTITISTLNSRPVADAGPDQTVTVGAQVTLDGSASHDADQNLLTYQWSFTSFPGSSAPTLSNPSLVNPTFAAGLAGLYVVQLIVNDGTLSSGPNTVLVGANQPANRAPVANNDGYTTDEDVTLVVATPGVLANDSDPDGDALTAILQSTTANGTLNLYPNGSFTYTPNLNFFGTDSFTYRVFDGSLYSNVATVTITVNPVNDLPVANAGSDQQVYVGDTVQLNGSGSDADGDPLIFQWSFISRPTGSTAVLLNSNIVSPSFVVDKNGNYVVQLLVNDGTSNSAPYTVTISTINRPPLANSQNINVHQDSPKAITLTGSDPDGDPLTFAVISNPTHGTLSGTPPTLTYTPNQEYLGPDGFDFQVSDGNGGTATATVSITVIANQVPRITSMPLTVAGVDYEYRYQVVATDPDGDPLAYTLVAAPAGMAIDNSGVIRWTPTGLQLSDFQISISVADGFGGIDTQTYWIRVSAGDSVLANHAPIAHAGDDFTMEEGANDELDGSHSYDADGDHLRYNWRQITGPTVTLDNYHAQKPRFTASQVDINTVLTFELIVNDGTVDSAPAKVNVMVLNIEVDPYGIVTNSNLDGPGSLKAAVEYANAHPGTRITFNILDTDPNYGKNTPGVWWLPIPGMGAISNYGPTGLDILGNGTFIDATTQTINQGDRNPYGPEIELDASTVGLRPIEINADNVVIRGLAIDKPRNADPAILVRGGSNIVISGNYIGTDATGMTSNTEMGGWGLEEAINVGGYDSVNPTPPLPIENLRIGGSRPGDGNIIFVMDEGGIIISGTRAMSIAIQGNFIGVNRTGAGLITNITGPGGLNDAISIRNNDAHVLIGGSTPGSRNIISGAFTGISHNWLVGQNTGSLTIQGNYIGTDVTGSIKLGNSSYGIYIRYSPSNSFSYLIGGSIPGAGNVISGLNLAIRLDGNGSAAQPGSPPVRIQGNLIGTDLTGTRVIGNSLGVQVYSGQALIGGTGPGEGNVIGGSSDTGIVMGNRPPSYVEVKGNKIGIGLDGVTPVPNRDGIRIFIHNSGVPLGGLESGAGNTIAFNQRHGVNFLYWDNGSRWVGSWGRVLGNQIYGNGGMGISHRYDSPIINDSGDANSGHPDYSQNHPVITGVTFGNGVTIVRGTLDTIKPQNCLIEIFANRVMDTTGYGEGEQLLTALYPAADGTFEAVIPGDLSGKYLTATATRMVWETGDPPLNSSEFSQALLVGTAASTNLPPTISSVAVTSATVDTPYSYQVFATDPEGGTLRYSLAMAPAGISISPTGLISWTPNAQQEGRQVVTVVVYDPQGLYASQNFVIQVLPLVDVVPPVILPTIPSGLTISTPYQLTGTICDTYLVRYGIEIAPAGTGNYTQIGEGNLCVQNGVLGTIDPTRLANGLYDLRFTAYDEGGRLTVYNSPEPIEVTGKLKIGQFSLAFQDISVPVSGIPINVIRSYNSFNKKQGDFGIGWDMALGTGVKVQVTRTLGTDWRAEEDFWWGSGTAGAWSYKLVTNKIPKVLITYADGKQDRFEFKPDFFRSTLPPYPALDQRFALAIYQPLEGTTSKLEAVGDTDLILLSNQLLDSDLDLYNPILFKLTTADGMVLMISKTEGLKSITDRNGNTITFSPTGIAHSSGLSINMQRDLQGRIARITDPMSNYVGYSYDANGDLITFTDQGGNITRFGYDLDHNLLSITDPRGIQILQTQYDAQGRMIGTVDGLGKTTEVTHDAANATEYVKDRNGFTTVYEYDSDGNIIAVTDPLGSRTQYIYDTNGNQLSKTDPLGNTWMWTYDANNNKLSETNPLGNTKRWTYNTRNQILTDTDALGNVTSYTYDGNGKRTSKTDATGNVTTYVYNAAGNLLSTTDCFGTTIYEYDGNGRKVRETDALGNVTTYTYDSGGNELTMTRTRTIDAGPVVMTTTKEYDGTGQLVRQTDPDGSVTATKYNSLRKKSASVDKRGNRTTYEYDAVGSLTRTTYPDGTTEVNTYDGNGNRITFTDRAGRITTFEYDPVKGAEDDPSAQNRLVRTIFPDGASTRMEYDIAGRIAATIDENRNRTFFTYDSAGRRTTVTNALGHVTTFAYNANGNQITMTDANGNTTAYSYDALNRQIGVTFDDGTSTNATYAGCGVNRKTSETDQAGNTTSFAYDAIGRLIRVTDAMGGQTTYTYDEVGNKLTQTDPNGNTTSWSYDNMGRVLKRTLPLGMFETFTYDANGNVLEKTDFNGSTITYSYDVMNRLTNKIYPDTPQVTYAYTLTGRRSSVNDYRGVTSYAYDQRDRLLNVTNPDSSQLSYAYDAKGNRTRVTIPSGVTNYTFDALNRLSTVTDPDGNITSYTYDNVGNRATLTYPNGTMTEYQYNTLNRLTYLENRKTSGEVISSYTYTLGPNGNRTRVTENIGRVVDYTYDALNRLTQEQITDSVLGNQTIAYTYDAFGNRLTKTDSTGTTTYTYNANDQLLTETAPGFTTTYEYDLNGNTVRKTEGTTITTYSYDFENKLIGSQTGSQWVTYEYDVDGIRTKATTSTATTNYLVDKNLKYAQVLEERDGNNSLIVSYVHGDDLISQKRGSVFSYYHYDGQMSTRRLTNSAGSTTDSYAYDAFGSLLDRQGSTINNYLYTGQQYDPNIGFYFLRARYYSPETGRFLNLDVTHGNIYDPVSLHKYLYANANPIFFIDPSGNTSLVSVMISIAIIGILASVLYAGTAHLVSYARTPVRWQGGMMYGGGGAGFVGALGMVGMFESECRMGKKGKGFYVMAMAGVMLGPPWVPVSVAITSASLITPGLFGTSPWTLVGPFTWISATGGWAVNLSYTVMYMGMGIGEMSWVPGIVLGIDIGIDVMGGIALPIPGSFSSDISC
jgi:RHS repeat-associated protein